MRFCGNLSTLFNDVPKISQRFLQLIERKDYQFQAVECQNPYDVSIEEWKDLVSKNRPVQWVLINSVPLFEQTKEIPSFEQYQQLVLHRTLDYAKALKVSKVHLLMMDTDNDTDRGKIIDLVHQAARFFEPHKIMCLVEPLSTRPNYYLRSYSTAMDIVRSSPTENLKVMLDSLHLQRLHGNLTERVKELIPFVGHVQISQTPNRNCPITDDGEVNHRYFLSKLIAPFYQDFIGLEYLEPSTGSFAWLNEFAAIK